MLIDERRVQVQRALQSVKGISPQERHQIAALDLAIYDSMLIAQLRRAYHMLTLDHNFDWKTREDSWHLWRDQTVHALEGSLRFRENEALIVAVGVCSALFPIIHQGAGLMAYKTLDDVALAAQRSGWENKRERSHTRLRLKNIITRASLLWYPPNDVVPNGMLSPTPRPEIGTYPTETAGVALEYNAGRSVMRLVACVLPIYWQTIDAITYVTVLP
jgi:hypothetical protein